VPVDRDQDDPQAFLAVDHCSGDPLQPEFEERTIVDRAKIGRGIAQSCQRCFGRSRPFAAWSDTRARSRGVFPLLNRFRRRWRDLRVRLTRNAIFRNRYRLGVSIANKGLRYFEVRLYVIVFEIIETELVPKNPVFRGPAVCHHL
jgi:hypothetical protein